MVELASPHDMTELVSIIVQHTADAVGAAVATLSVVEPDGLTVRLAGVFGAQPGTPLTWTNFPLSADLPACDAIRRREPVIVVGTREIEARYSMLAGAVRDERTLMCLPLCLDVRTIGALGLLFPGHWQPAPAESQFLSTFAVLCAQAIERVRALSRAQANERRLEFLVSASAQLGRSIDLRTTLRRVSRLAVPDLADWCAVEIVEDGMIRTVAVSHAVAAHATIARRWRRRRAYPVDSDVASARVVRRGVSELHRELTDAAVLEILDGSADVGTARSAMVVPLRSGGNTLGALTMISAGEYGITDLMLAEDVGKRAAVAIDNARLHSEIRDLSVELRRAMSPKPPPLLAEFEAAAEYHAAGSVDVGGDFYELVELSDGRVAAVIADVMGHGVHAAAVMGPIRFAVRAFLAVDARPATVAERMDTLFAMYRFDHVVTMLCLLLDPGAGTAEVVSCGHLPMALVGRDSTVTWLGAGQSPPLGLASQPRESIRHPFGTGVTALVFTDGLVERRDEDISVGLARLSGRLATLAKGSLSERLATLVSAVRDERRTEDVTALALRRRARG
jgi:GAF domain-containing protein